MQDNSLRQSLKQRHITMIALGGVIGAGLFVGSGAIIATAGPAAILSYLIGGVIVTLVMFMLGEMASRNPDSGSFSTYASSYLGEWAGFAVGWLYWFKSMMTITVEAILLGLTAQPNGRTPISQPCRNRAKTAHTTSPATIATTSPDSLPAG